MHRPFLISASLLITTVSHAKSLSNKQCDTLKKCSEVVSKTLGHQYFYADELKGKIEMGKGLIFNKQNAEKLFTEFLNLHGYTRVNVSENLYKIIPARDIRYTPTKVFRHEANKLDEVPDLSDYYMLSYQLKFPANAAWITRSFRPFMSRYGRIIDNRATGRILIQDTGTNLRRLVGLLSELDKKLDDKELEVLQKEEKRRHEISMEKEKNCKG